MTAFDSFLRQLGCWSCRLACLSGMACLPVVIYALAYFSLVIPTVDPHSPTGGKRDQYRHGGMFSQEFFYPMYRFDRKCRSELWGKEDPGYRGTLALYEPLSTVDRLSLWWELSSWGFRSEYLAP
jgi:hypothetical protein